MRFRSGLIGAVIVGALGGAGALVAACKSTGDCGNGTCACARGASCDFTCSAPPCHVECDGDNASCTGACANGTCTCGPGSRCDFSCAAPPCHVNCASTSICRGTCANGQCDCGPGAECTFTCSASPCHSTCGSGAKCVVECPNGLAGTASCDIVQCLSGAVVVCPGGGATTCNAPCP